MQNNLIFNYISTLNKAEPYLINAIPARNTLIVVVLGSLLYAISARVQIDIPPVPVTLQTLVLFVFSMSVGWRLSTLTFLTYLFYGSIGLPFFANPPYGGFAYLAGPSGGYLFGMLFASFVVGYLAEKNYDKKYFKSLFAIFIGTFLIFFFGLLWLTYWLIIQPDSTIDFLCDRENIQCTFSNWNISQSFNLALILGLFKFIITEPIKIAIAATVIPVVWKLIKK